MRRKIAWVPLSFVREWIDPHRTRQQRTRLKLLSLMNVCFLKRLNRCMITPHCSDWFYRNSRDQGFSEGIIDWVIFEADCKNCADSELKNGRWSEAQPVNIFQFVAAYFGNDEIYIENRGNCCCNNGKKNGSIIFLDLGGRACWGALAINEDEALHSIDRGSEVDSLDE